MNSPLSPAFFKKIEKGIKAHESFKDTENQYIHRLIVIAGKMQPRDRVTTTGIRLADACQQRVRFIKIASMPF
jgi:hypothetical protein